MKLFIFLTPILAQEKINVEVCKNREPEEIVYFKDIPPGKTFKFGEQGLVFMRLISNHYAASLESGATVICQDTEVVIPVNGYFQITKD